MQQTNVTVATINSSKSIHFILDDFKLTKIQVNKKVLLTTN